MQMEQKKCRCSLIKWTMDLLYLKLQVKTNQWTQNFQAQEKY